MISISLYCAIMTSYAYDFASQLTLIWHYTILNLRRLLSNHSGQRSQFTWTDHSLVRAATAYSHKITLKFTVKMVFKRTKIICYMYDSYTVHLIKQITEMCYSEAACLIFADFSLLYQSWSLLLVSLFHHKSYTVVTSSPYIDNKWKHMDNYYADA